MPTSAEYEYAIALYQLYVAELEGKVAALTARVEELTKPVEPPKPPPVEPPVPPAPVKRMLVGSSVQAQGMTQAAAITKLETTIGKRLGIRREFDADGADVAWMKASAALDANRGRVYSFKGKAADFTRAVYDAIPTDGFPTYVCLQHEAERAEKGNDPAAMRAEFDAFIAKVRSYNKAASRTDVHATVIYTGYLDRDTSATTTTATWYPTDITDVVLGIDPYDPLAKKTLKEQYGPALATWRKAGGKRWGLAETGTHRTSDADRAAWIKQGFTDAKADGAEFISWFHSDVGGNAGTGWFLDGPLTIAEFAKWLPSVAS